MARKVFFSFHYDDVTRVNVVRKSDQITRLYQSAARFHDKSLWEEVKKQGPLAIKRMINGGLEGSSVTCVLIGQQTWRRPWVRYEILKSLSRGNGILGVHIHDVGFNPREQPILGSLLAPRDEQPLNRRNSLLGAMLSGERTQSPPPQPGLNPLRYLGYTIDRQRGTVRFHEVDSSGKWREHPDVHSVPLQYVQWMSRLEDADNLESAFQVYHWKRDCGYSYFPTWIEQAANKTGR